MAQSQSVTSTLAAYFEDSAAAREAVEALHEAGFTSAHIGVAHRGGIAAASTPQSGELGKSASTWDKIKNMFTGNEAEPYADERTQGEFASHEVTQNPAEENLHRGYGATDLQSSFEGLDLPQDRSRYFAHRLRSGQDGAVVTVNASDRRAEAESILIENGGDLAQNTIGYEQPAESVSEAEEAPNDIQLLGEVLRIHKDRVSSGEVRIRKEVITETQTVQVPVTREELVIERRAVSADTPAVGTIGETEIRIPLSEERASIDKSTVVREQVSVGKKSVEDVRDLTGEVRHEELIVDDSTKRTL